MQVGRPIWENRPPYPTLAVPGAQGSSPCPATGLLPASAPLPVKSWGEASPDIHQVRGGKRWRLPALESSKGTILVPRAGG